MARKKYYRNHLEVNGIDPEALWYRQGDKLILVDQDEFMAADFDPTNFYRVKIPPDKRKFLFVA